MKRLKGIVAYDGTDYSGFQVQPEQMTIQGEIEAAITRITGETIQIHGSGRTDAGVHARGQTFHFDTKSTISTDKWRWILNNQLPASIVMQSIEEVDPSFHARFDVREKEYRYCINNAQVPEVFRHRYAWHIRYPLDVKAMRQAATHLIGTHNFTSFCSARTHVENKVRTIYDVRIEQEGTLLWIICRGNGFLYNMVRIIAGTLLNVGEGKLSPTHIPSILVGCDRELAGKTAPPHGLTMWEVFYKE
ncbi:tRNA pseudouridine(38-40) synthase TruA [Brevibacterium sp. JNUCC-42]|nr:tRNA pseudouridine(38-40) synthase TruA [Brevibacterium sp. JNUCC-42]